MHTSWSSHCKRPPPEPPVDLPGAPFEEVPCPSCGGRGARLSLHPLYAGAEPCEGCRGDGTLLVESRGDEPCS